MIRSFLYIVILIGLGFIGGQFIKFSYASSQWDMYQQDFDWIHQNTAIDANFLSNWQCGPYNFERLSFTPKSEEFIDKSDYIWLNQKSNIDNG